MEQIIRLSKQKIANILLFVFFLIFPFGQIIKFGKVQPIDLVVILSFIVTFLSKQKESKIFVYIRNFLIIAIFSYLLSLFIFGFSAAITGGLYLIRLIVYSYFFLFALKFPKKLLVKSLLLVSVTSGVFGIFQYFLYPDVRALTFWGWDDHLFRMVGTFLDPAFLALILVLGATIALFSYLRNKRGVYILSFVFLTVCLAFTYSRAGYLTFILGMFLIALLKREFKLIIAGVVLFLLFLPFLPRPAGEGVRLERVASIVGRIGNYSESVRLFEKSPVFGVGYNNICLAKQKYLNFKEINSHSCSGLDSSIMVILVTTGLIGFFVFIHSALGVFKSLFSKSFYSQLFVVSALEVFINSFFANSLFYPWIMAWMAILLAVGDHN